VPDSNPIHIGDYVRISLLNNPTKYSEGEAYKIFLGTDPDKILVILKNGDSGTVIRVINSPTEIEKRIMHEGQYTENKEKFDVDGVRNEAIPKEIQSFLNSDGGYLYVGVRDTGSLEERLVGLDYDFDIIRHKDPNDLTDDKLCDKLEQKVMDTLAKYLVSKALLGVLVKIDFPSIRGTQIMQLTINKSPFPWFYRHITNSNKAKLLQVTVKDSVGPKHDRYLDDFYIRQGSSKKRLDTIEEFYNYSVDRFIT